MHLAMHAVANPRRFGEIAHLLHVALQRVQIQHQTGRLNIGLIHPRQRRNVIAHFQPVKFRVHIHDNLLTP